MSKNIRLFLLFIVFFGFFIGFLSQGPIRQRQDYHLLADQIFLFGIPHTWDVLTNLIFIIFGIQGVVLTLNQKQKITSHKSWLVFFSSILLIGPGSAYYHWEPNNYTLVWDRLPMGVGFMALYLILMIEHINPKWEKALLPFCFLGLSSVVIWAIFDDLRLYFWVQFSTFLTIPLILLLFRSSYSTRSGYYYCFFFYLLAKICEHFDHQIYDLTFKVISGHNLKHLLAGIGIWFLIDMLKSRIYTEKNST
jgi:hypothetical protein